MEEVKVSLEEIAAQNQVLKAQLTNKNEQYIYQLERTLRAANYSEAKLQEVLADMLPTIVDQQKKGMTARQLYGTVTECVESLQAGPKKNPNKKSPDWQIAVDGGLMVGGFFSLIAGIMLLLNSNTQTQPMGLITLIVNFIAGGLALLVLSKVAPDLNQPKGKQGYGRYLLVTTGAMLVWLVLVLGSQVLVSMAGLEIILPPFGYLVIGAAALLAKWYLKKTYDIRGGIL